jgi:hypothetical protein
MKTTLVVAFVVAILALSAGQLLAIETGTWECMGYTITVTPTDPDNPNLAGTIEITKADDVAEVYVSGTYARADGKKPATIVDVAGTITTPDGVIDVARVFTFEPGPKKSVWKTVVSWIESQIAS